MSAPSSDSPYTRTPLHFLHADALPQTRAYVRACVIVRVRVRVRVCVCARARVRVRVRVHVKLGLALTAISC